jgi:hypothetical protein
MSKPQFDLKTHVRDGKGNIVHENHYVLTIQNGNREYERPPGSGYFYAENGELLRSPDVSELEVETAPTEVVQDVLLNQIEELKAQLVEAKAAQAQAESQEEVEVPVEPEIKPISKPSFLR